MARHASFGHWFGTIMRGKQSGFVVHGGFRLACGRNRFHTSGVDDGHDHGTATGGDAQLTRNGQVAVGHENVAPCSTA